MLMVLEIGLAIGLVGMLFIAWFIGRAYSGSMTESVAKHPQLGMIQGAILALLGLLLGFCFAGAISRFVDRQHVLGREGSAITTLYDMAGLVPDEHSAAMRGLLHEYAVARRELFNRSRLQSERDMQVAVQKIQQSMWDRTKAAVAAMPTITAPLTGAVAEVGNSLAERNNLDARHVPTLVFVILAISAAASMAAVGLGTERAHGSLRRPAIVLILLVAATLWTILDLDFPRLGLVKLNPKPLDEAIAYVRGGGQHPR